jgi:hypothetical protein
LLDVIKITVMAELLGAGELGFSPELSAVSLSRSYFAFAAMIYA